MIISPKCVQHVLFRGHLNLNCLPARRKSQISPLFSAKITKRRSSRRFCRSSYATNITPSNTARRYAGSAQQRILAKPATTTASRMHSRQQQQAGSFHLTTYTTLLPPAQPNNLQFSSNNLSSSLSNISFEDWINETIVWLSCQL